MIQKPLGISWLKIIGVAVLYAGLAKLVLTFFSDTGNVTFIWFPAGLGLAAFLLGGTGYWPGVFLGAFLAGMLVGDSWLISACIAAGNTLESWSAAWLLLGNPGFSITLRRPRDFAWLAATGMLTACFSTLIGPMTLLSSQYLSRETLLSSMLHWWMADVLGIALVTPLILVWRRWPNDWFGVKRLPETLALFGFSFLVGQAIFWDWFPEQVGKHAQTYWLFLFVVWAAVRFGRHGVLLLMAMTAAQSLSGLEHGVGAFASEQLQSGLLNIWFYLSIQALVGIPLALTLYEREQVNHSLQQSESRLSFALETIDTGAWDLNLADYSMQRTPIHDRIFGYSHLLPEWSYQAMLGHVLPEYRDQIDAGLRKARDEQSNWNFECRIRRVDGEIRWIRGAGCYQQGSPAKITGIIQDITATKLAEEDRQLTALFYLHCSEAMMVTDLEATILSVNPAFTRITGYDADDVLGRNARMLGSGRHEPAFFETMWQTLLDRGQWQGEIWNRRKNGELYVEQLSIDTIFDKNGQPLRRIGLFFDITQRKLDEEHLWKQANFDPLTGIGNRRMFYDRLEQELRKAQRSCCYLGLLIVEIRQFRDINDALGYGGGDQVLQEAAQRLLTCVRDTDLVARVDGAEFAVLLPELERIENAERIAKIIIAKLGQPYTVGNRETVLTCRIGIAICPDHAITANALREAGMTATQNCEARGYCFAAATH